MTISGHIEREKRIQDRIAQWHDEPGHDPWPEIWMALGWTREEYARWVETNKPPPEREGAF